MGTVPVRITTRYRRPAAKGGINFMLFIIMIVITCLDYMGMSQQFKTGIPVSISEIVVSPIKACINHAKHSPAS